ncbi:MAG: sulfatase family protein [Planctomycetota bacterium]|jgi:N-acetylglucosamine-6-sulfatase
MAPTEKPERPPNLLFVLTDQMRAHALGFMGEDPVVTPNLDRFASESFTLPYAASNYPVCSPCRAMLMTGKYPHANGVIANCTSKTEPFGCELRTEDRCWSDVLDDQGYSLGHIGKWHLDSPRRPFVESYNNRPDFAWNEWCPPERRHGFDFWYSYGTFDQHMHPEYWSTDMTRDERIKVDQWGPEHETDLAIRYLRNEGGEFREGDRPFALVVSFNPPHTPYKQHPERYAKAYEGKSVDDLLKDRPNVLPPGTKWGDHTRKWIRDYLEMVTGVDDQFGRLMACLDEEGLRENTVVVFTSDHGDCLGMNGENTKNNHYELSMRVPFMLRWPGKVAPRHDDLLLSSPDIYPTVLDLMGHVARVPEAVQGTSHARVALGREGPRPTSQPYMKIPYSKPAEGKRGVRTHRHTLMIERRKDGDERVVLHDREADPHQLKNIAGAEPAIVERLFNDELAPWLEKTGDPWRRA